MNLVDTQKLFNMKALNLLKCVTCHPKNTENENGFPEIANQRSADLCRLIKIQLPMLYIAFKTQFVEFDSKLSNLHPTADCRSAGNLG